jgi:hypothetical protein
MQVKFLKIEVKWKIRFSASWRVPWESKKNQISLGETTTEEEPRHLWKKQAFESVKKNAKKT